MNKTTLTLTAAALMACAGTASATTVTQTKTTGPSILPINTTQSFAQHNGTLSSLSDTITETLTEKLVFTNTSAASGTIMGHLTNTATKVFPGLMVSVTNIGVTLSSGLLAPGASITKTGTSTNSATVVGTPAMFAAFEGAGTVTATVTDIGSLTCTGPIGNGGCNFTDTGTVTDVLHYDFTTTTTPEPATLALLGTGLAALGFARRRRRSKQ